MSTPLQFFWRMVHNQTNTNGMVMTIMCQSPTVSMVHNQPSEENVFMVKTANTNNAAKLNNTKEIDPHRLIHTQRA